MARGLGSRGGRSPRGGSGGRPSGGPGKASAGRSSSGGAAAGKPKGQINSGKTVQYSLQDSRGNTTYIGSTNNPTRRTAQHQQSGKMQPGDKLRVETKAIPRKVAEKVEAAKLASHRQNHGQNPRKNNTNDGRFHP